MGYRQIQCLGSGYFGEVWLEHDDGLDRLCAAKHLNPTRLAPGVDANAEAQAMMIAQHDNVVSVFSADMVAGAPVIRMEYLSEGSVAGRYKGGPVPVRDAVQIMEEACRGVEHLHARGLLHRDIKPGNLLLTEAGSVKVSDFGLSCQQGATTGIPPWNYTIHLPPEAVSGGVGITTVEGDVYALGVTTYRLLNGDSALVGARVPASRLSAAIIAGHYPDRSHWEPYIQPALRRVVRRALHIDPAKRYATAATFRHALERVRPAVSWWPYVAATGRAWQGASPDGTTWRATIEPRPRGGYRFMIERRLPGKAWRQQTADGLEVRDEVDALAQSEQVMGRVAQAGR